MVLRKTGRTILLISRLKNSEKQNRQECKRFLAGFVLVEKNDEKELIGASRRLCRSLRLRVQDLPADEETLCSGCRWIVTLLGSLLITVLSFVMILTVYGRMFKIYMYTAIAPIPISSFAGEPTQSIGKNFIRSYIGVCLEGAIIALACIIFSAYAASPPAVGDTELSAVTIVWNYVGELVFNLLVLVGAIKASDRIVSDADLRRRAQS